MTTESSPSWWRRDGLVMRFKQQPPKGWERLGPGHYDRYTEQWVDEPAEDTDEETEGDIKAARAAYQAKFGKKPYHGWDAATLLEKLG